jgi:two-component system, chemotaxis family, protein-glutamate methylesterase/glutaminase
MSETGRPFRAVVVGGSAGSVDALAAFFAALPADVRLPIAVVVHMPQDGPGILHELLAPHSRLSMKQAEDKEPAAEGTVYFAPPGYHLLIETDASFSLSIDEPVQYSRPSIDVLFESAADCYRDQLIGILLSGANQDGAAGLERIRKRGGLSIVQHPATADAPFMPQAAIERRATEHIVPLAELGAFTAARIAARGPLQGKRLG